MCLCCVEDVFSHIKHAIIFLPRKVRAHPYYTKAMPFFGFFLVNFVQ